MSIPARKDSPTMSRSSLLIAVAALGLGVSACAPTGGPLTAGNNPSLYSVHQPVVQRTDFVIDLNAGGGQVPASELARLDAWLESIGADYGDRISVDEPGYPSASVRGDIANVAARYGLLLADAAPVTTGAVPPGTVRVVASRATASVPGCPAWNSDDLAPNSATSPNFGCATNSNLAAMVANPEDLVLGQGASTSGSATTATRAIRTYRERQPTGREDLPTTSTTRGNSQ